MRANKNCRQAILSRPFRTQMFWGHLPRPPGCALRPGLSYAGLSGLHTHNLQLIVRLIIDINILMETAFGGLKGRHVIAQVEGRSPEAWVNGPKTVES
jgi:hypothetical protein